MTTDVRQHNQCPYQASMKVPTLNNKTTHSSICTCQWSYISIYLFPNIQCKNNNVKFDVHATAGKNRWYMYNNIYYVLV